MHKQVGQNTQRLRCHPAPQTLTYSEHMIISVSFNIIHGLKICSYTILKTEQQLKFTQIHVLYMICKIYSLAIPGTHIHVLVSVSPHTLRRTHIHVVVMISVSAHTRCGEHTCM